MCKKFGQIMTLTKKLCKKIVSVFIIAFPKLPQKCVQVPKIIVKCQKYRPGPPAPEGGLKYDIYKKLGHIMTLTKKLCKKSGLVFIIPFHKLPQKCLKVPKKVKKIYAQYAYSKVSPICGNLASTVADALLCQPRRRH